MFTFGSKPDDGIVLKTGSFMHRMHQRIRGMLSQGLIFHMGKAFSMISALTSDWVIVRVALMFSSACSTTFHFIFPDPRPMRMLYGALFFVGHAYALFMHTLEYSNLWTIQDQQKRELYENFFKEVGFTVYHMKRIMEECEGSVVTFRKGDYIVEQGNEIKYAYIIIDGEIDFIKEFDESDARLNHAKRLRDNPEKYMSKTFVISSQARGGIVGELYDENWE